MAAPVIVKAIGLKVTGANIGEFAIIRNFTRGGQLTQKLSGSDRSTVFNPAPDLEWKEGDVVQAEIRGRITGAKKTTLTSRGAEITITGATDTSTDGVVL